MKIFSLLGRNLRVEIEFDTDNNLIKRMGVYCVNPIHSRESFAIDFNQSIELMMDEDASFLKATLTAKNGISNVADMVWDSGHEYFDGSFEEDMKMNEDGNNFGLELGSEINEIIELKVEGA